jgi:hypothetical protein
MRPPRTSLIAVSLVAGLAAAWLLSDGLSFGGAAGSADAPPCESAEVEKMVLHIFNRHPQYAGRSGKVMIGLVDVREVEFRRHPEVEASANTRWCEGLGRFSGGETETVYWDLFSTRNLLSMYGVRPCFGRFDPLHKDCSFARPPKR